jgi:hypothetical protein
MKFTAMALASVFAFLSTCAFAHTVRHKSNVGAHTVYRDYTPSIVFRPNYRHPNGNDTGWSHQMPAPTQSSSDFDDPEGKDSRLSLPY